MSDRDYGHVCVHGSLARSCEVCDLEDLLDAVQEALTWAEAPVRHDGGYLSLAERVRWLHQRGRDRHRERDEARAEVRQLRDLAWDVTEQIHRNLVEHPEPWFMETLDKLVDLIGDEDDLE